MVTNFWLSIVSQLSTLRHQLQLDIVFHDLEYFRLLFAVVMDHLSQVSNYHWKTYSEYFVQIKVF